MWSIEETSRARSELRKTPAEILKKYEIWKNVVRFSGPEGLRGIRGYKDSAMKGEWAGYRHSRLNEQYRVVYKTVGKDVQIVEVARVTPHDYTK